VQVDSFVFYDIIWNIAAPLKVLLLVWQLLLNCLPTKDNLIGRGIIPSNSSFWSSDCGKEKSVDHVFMGCVFLGSIWSLL